MKRLIAKIGSPRFARVLGWGLVAVGFMQTVGYLVGSPVLRGLGLACTASPLPIVFSDVKGLETFASSFTLELYGEDGQRDVMEITPALYSELGGPYNRRNVYGAAISYGPKLPEAIWKSVLSHGFCGYGPLARSFGLRSKVGEAVVLLKTKTAGRKDTYELRVQCGTNG